MPKRFATKIGPRDIEILTALDRTPLTPAQLRQLSCTFISPFRDEHNLRRRLRLLAESGLVKSWPYALASEGRSPRYFKLTREGFRLLYDDDTALPSRRVFEEISHGHHFHMYALAELIVHVAITAHDRGIILRHFARENSVKLEASGFTMYPDCAFQLVTAANRTFNLVVELDNGTERVRTRQDVESIERKLRGYDAHQSQFAVNDKRRYCVLFVTTRSHARMRHILDLADMVTTNRERTIFIASDLQTVVENDPFSSAIFHDHRGLKRTIIPSVQSSQKKAPTSMTPTTVS